MENNALMPITDIFEGQPTKLWASLDTSTEEGKINLIKALGNADYSAEDLAKVPFPTENIVVHQVNIETEDGETIEANRTVLIGPDGQTASFVSQGVISSLRNIFAVFGLPPWKPPLALSVKEVRTRKGWKTLNLIVNK